MAREARTRKALVRAMAAATKGMAAAAEGAEGAATIMAGEVLVDMLDAAVMPPTVEMATATVTHLKEAAAVAAVGTTRLRGVLLQAAVSG